MIYIIIMFLLYGIYIFYVKCMEKGYDSGSGLSRQLHFQSSPGDLAALQGKETVNSVGMVS